MAFISNSECEKMNPKVIVQLILFQKLNLMHQSINHSFIIYQLSFINLLLLLLFIN